MVEEERVDLLAERLVDRIQKANEYILKRMGENVNKIKKLTPTEARRLINILKYGGTYEEIVNKLSEYTGLDIKDIDEIFKEYAKEDQAFYKQFYQYKDIPFVPYENNYILKNQTQALANIAKNEMYNFTRDNILGYTIRDLNGNVTFKGIRETYNELLDNALINVSQGTDTFDSAMTHILKEIGSSGIKTLQYQNGRAIRLDSAVRMHLKSRINELHNENQKLFGNEFGFDGWEISVHGNPAPDHQDVQGRQFTIDEYNKLQEEGKAKDYKGKSVDIRSFSKKGNMSYRPISEMNCYHKAFPIILGVSEPEYTDEELKEIKDQANERFEFEGKEYSMYEATQLQRALERKIREQKDIHILAKESNNKPLMQEAQTKINLYRTKYGQLSQASGLPIKSKRMAVSGYKRIKIDESSSVNDVKTYKDYFEGYNNADESRRFDRAVEVDNIFTKKYKNVYKNMENDEKEAISKYSGPYYKDIQKVILGRNIDDTDNYMNLGMTNVNEYKTEVNKWIKKMDDVINKSTIDEDIVLWKGTNEKHFEGLKNGDVFTTDVYTGTSINRTVAESYMWNKDGAVALKILTPKGTKGIYIGGDIGLGEAEMLLGRKQEYKYLREYEETGLTDELKKRKVKIIEVEAVK